MATDRNHPAPVSAPMALDEALARVVRDFGPVTGVETVPLRDSLGRILAEPVTAPVDVPPAAVSAMDGYAYAMPQNPGTNPGTPLRLPLVGRVPAGA